LSKRYALQQIIDAGRWAWASSQGEEADCYFDGILFWHEPKAGERHSF
jgi:hypothetical protein